MAGGTYLFYSVEWFIATPMILQFKCNLGQKHGQLNEFSIIRQLNEHRQEIATLRYSITVKVKQS